jgi:hypothetical protein
MVHNTRTVSDSGMLVISYALCSGCLCTHCVYLWFSSQCHFLFIGDLKDCFNCKMSAQYSLPSIYFIHSGPSD